ncbi:MAG: anti-sigma-factor antagonist protein [Ilumatobacteraceae bacterium]|nr:anti-sigma-factor antagonist protein [Ilumatobacteraceae bacterium]
MTETMPEAEGEAISFDRSGRQLTVYLSGDLDLSSGETTVGAVLRQHRLDDERVWLDLSGVAFCDSSGLGMLMRLHEIIEARGSLFVVFDPAPQVRQLLDMTGLSAGLKIRTS